MNALAVGIDQDGRDGASARLVLLRVVEGRSREGIEARPS